MRPAGNRVAGERAVALCCPAALWELLLLLPFALCCPAATSLAMSCRISSTCRNKPSILCVVEELLPSCVVGAAAMLPCCVAGGGAAAMLPSCVVGGAAAMLPCCVVGGAAGMLPCCVVGGAAGMPVPS